jgi:predicted GIY-YIG superfamily endonuclease
MLNYAKAKIYILINDVNKTVYIGSTCGSLLMKIGMHRNLSYDKTTTTYNSSLNVAMREINRINSSHFKIHLMKEFPCTRASELEHELYRVIQEEYEKGVPLYNDNLVPLRRTTMLGSSAYVRVPREADYSTVRYRDQKDRAQYILLRFKDGVMGRSSTFSVRKYGDAGAMQMAFDMQAAEQAGNSKMG